MRLQPSPLSVDSEMSKRGNEGRARAVGAEAKVRLALALGGLSGVLTVVFGSGYGVFFHSSGPSSCSVRAVNCDDFCLVEIGRDRNLALSFKGSRPWMK